MLKDEYSILDTLDNFEDNLSNLSRDIPTYDIQTLWYEKDNMWKMEKEMKDKLDQINEYLPKCKVVNAKEVPKLLNSFKDEFSERIKEYVVDIDTDFSLDNYHYVLDELNNYDVAKVYKTLGPFDFFAKKDDEDLKELMNFQSTRVMEDKFQIRKRSGNKYRGEIYPENDKPDGRGFKVFSNGGVYEGDFGDG